MPTATAPSELPTFKSWKAQLAEVASLKGADHERLLDIFHAGGTIDDAIRELKLERFIDVVPETQAAAAKKEAAAAGDLLPGIERDEDGFVTRGGREIKIRIRKGLKYNAAIDVAEVRSGRWWFGWTCEEDVNGGADECGHSGMTTFPTQEIAIAKAFNSVRNWIRETARRGKKLQASEAMGDVDKHLQELLGKASGPIDNGSPENGPPARNGKTQAAKAPVAHSAPSSGKVGQPPARADIEILELSVRLIDLRPDNPRKSLDEKALLALAEAIDTVGLQNPIIVRRKADSDRFELWQGERRLRAVRDKLKRQTIKARVVTGDDAAMVAGRAFENLAREDLNPIERAMSLQQMLDAGSYKSQRDLGQAVGLSQGEISNLTGLLKLPAEWQKKVISGEIGPAHARVLTTWIDRPTVLKAAERLLASWIKNHPDGRNVTVRDFESVVQNAVNRATRSLSKSQYMSGQGCHFTPTKEQREALDLISVKRYGYTESRAFNIALWKKLNDEAKARKQKRAAEESESGERTSSKPKVAGPSVERVEHRLVDRLAPMVGTTLTRSAHRDLALRLLLVVAGTNSDSISKVASGGKDGRWLSSDALWQWAASLDRKSLEDAVIAIVREELDTSNLQDWEDRPVEASVLKRVIDEMGLHVFKVWTPEPEDLDVYPIELLRKMPAAKRAEFPGDDKAQLIEAMITHWKPGELPKEFEKALKG